MHLILILFDTAFLLTIYFLGVKADKTLRNVNDSLVEDAANFATNKVNYLSIYSYCTYRECLANIDDQKVVNNTLFILTIHIGTSFCGNNDLNANSTTKNCALQPGMQHRECNVTVFYASELRQFDMLNLSCEPKQYPNERRENVDIYDSTVKAAALYSVNDINYKRGYSPFEYRLELAKIDHGTSEVLDGGYYNLMIYVGPSICPNIPVFENSTTKECPLETGKPLQGHNVTVVYQPWTENPFRVENGNNGTRLGNLSD